jgi:hypothetical protein
MSPTSYQTAPPRGEHIYVANTGALAKSRMRRASIGIIINSMEEARQIEHSRERRAQRAAADVETTQEDRDEQLASRIATLRDALESLEDELAAGGP